MQVLRRLGGGAKPPQAPPQTPLMGVLVSYSSLIAWLRSENWYDKEEERFRSSIKLKFNREVSSGESLYR